MILHFGRKLHTINGNLSKKNNFYILGNPMKRRTPPTISSPKQ